MEKHTNKAGRAFRPSGILIRLLVICLLSVGILAALPGSKAQAAHLNKYKKTLFVDESFRLKVIGTSEKVTFTSSKKSVATVTKNGKIVGRRRGKAVITAKAGTSTYQCVVTVNNMKDTYMKKARNLINAQRRNYGVEPLCYNRYLQEAAQKRAKELSVSYSHIRPNKTQFTSAISSKYRYSNYRYEIIGRAIPSPKRIVNAWMKNADTKKAIIGSAYEDIGVGYYVAEDGTEYWCAIVAKKK